MPLVTRSSSRRMSRHAPEHVAGVEEPHELEVLPVGARVSRLKIAMALPPWGNPFGSSVSALPRRSSAKPRTVVSPPAKNRSLAGNSRMTVGNASTRSTARVSVPSSLPAVALAKVSDLEHAAAPPAKSRPPRRGARRRRPPPRGPAGGDTRNPGRSSSRTPLRSPTPWRPPRCRSRCTAPRCGSSTSSRESRSTRAEDLRQPHLGKQAIDQQLILDRDRLFEDLGVVEGVAAGVA